MLRVKAVWVFFKLFLLNCSDFHIQMGRKFANQPTKNGVKILYGNFFFENDDLGSGKKCKMMMLRSGFFVVVICENYMLRSGYFLSFVKMIMLRSRNLGLKMGVSHAAHTQYAYIWRCPPPPTCILLTKWTMWPDPVLSTFTSAIPFCWGENIWKLCFTEIKHPWQNRQIRMRVCQITRILEENSWKSPFIPLHHSA